MKTKFLLFTSILLLFNSNSFSEEKKNLPSLPMNSSIETQDTTKTSKSFWRKTKDFFGFGEKEEKKTSTENHTENEKHNFIDDNQEGDDIKIPPGFEKDIDEKTSKITNLVEGISKAEEDKNKIEDKESFAVDRSHKTSDEVANTPLRKRILDKNEEELKLPEGFDDFGGDNNEKVASEGLNPDKKLPELTTIKEEDPNRDQDNVIEVNTDKDKNSLETTINKDENTINTPNPLDKTIEKSDEVLPTPDYAIQTDNSEEPKKKLDKIIGVFKKNKTNPSSLPQVSQEDYAENNKGEPIKKESVELDADQLRFINNEIQVLILPNDDIVLGKITEQAKIIKMPLNEYIKKFWDNYNRIKREPQRQAIESYIDSYEENFYEDSYI